MVRVLLRIPAVRRVLARLANAEDAIASAEAAIHEQQVRLGAMTSALTSTLSDQDGRLARLTATLSDHRGALSQLRAGQHNERALLAEVATHMPPAERAKLELTLQDHQRQLTALTAALSDHGGTLTRLSADQVGERALLAEVAAHMPPDERAKLETALQGLQVQLAALDSAMRANQMQLEALNGVVEHLNRQHAGLETTQALAKLNHENRLLRVGHGPTFEELAAAGNVLTGLPYGFGELLSFRLEHDRPIPSVPPLVFMHIPKTGGTTVNRILMKNYHYRLDSYGTDFFPRYYPDEFRSLVQPPQGDDPRRPVYFTGHIDVANELFRYMPVRYVAITMLRDPVARVVSHYRSHSRLADSPLAAEIANGRLGIVDYFRRFRETIRLQYEVFAPRASAGERPHVVEEALHNLDSRVSFFGVQEEFDAFAVLMAELLGLADVHHLPLNRTPADAATVTPSQRAELRELLATDVAFYDGAVALYHQRKQTLPFALEAQARAFHLEQDAYLERRARCSHRWQGFYS
jgi:hypothetical protein